VATDLTRSLAELLDAEAAEIVARWRQQALAVAPRTGSALDGDAGVAEAALRAMAAALRNGPGASDAVIKAGWAYGAVAHAEGRSLHYVLKELDLLTAIVLYAFERAEPARTPAADAASAFLAARQWHRGMSLLTLSAAKGFTHAYLKELQAHYRDLRHDLRNPLGTIRSAVSLMDDESVPDVMRNDPRFRAMVVRNAKFMDAVIGQQLSEASTLAPAFARQEVSLRDVAWSVRRDIRDDALAAGFEIEVSSALPTLLTDSAGFELALKSVVSAALHHARAPSVIAIGLRELREHSAVVSVAMELTEPEVDLIASGALAFAQELAARCGGRLWMDGAVCLEVPILAHAGDNLARGR
jgi:signal transduction histidine kinase